VGLIPFFVPHFQAVFSMLPFDVIIFRSYRLFPNKKENLPKLSAWGAAHTSKMAKARMKTNFVIILLI
jgi:hypothetical protein